MKVIKKVLLGTYLGICSPFIILGIVLGTIWYTTVYGKDILNNFLRRIQE